LWPFGEHDENRRDFNGMIPSREPVRRGALRPGCGVEEAPAVVRSWEDLATGSAFLDRLFHEGPARRRLPAHVAYGLFFTYRWRSGQRTESGDCVIPLASQLRPEAQEEATTIRGFDEDHTSVLRSRAVAAALNAFLG
jgi:hypothetical protein